MAKKIKLPKLTLAELQSNYELMQDDIDEIFKRLKKQEEWKEQISQPATWGEIYDIPSDEAVEALTPALEDEPTYGMKEHFQDLKLAFFHFWPELLAFGVACFAAGSIFISVVK